MKRFVKRMLALTLSACMVLPLAACSSSSSGTSSAGGSTASAAASSALDKNASLTLKILNWGSTSEEKICNDAIARFNKVYPNIKVQQTCVPVTEWSDFIQKWTTMITSGDAPDVINYGLEATQMAVKNNLLYKLDNIISSDSTLSANKGNYAKSLINGFTVGGSLYGIPNGTQTMVMYYNKTIFKKLGISDPTDNWTWDDFYKIAAQITKSGVYGFGLSSSYFQLTPWWVTNGAYPTSTDYSKPTLNSAGMVDSVTFLEKLVKEKITPDPISSDVYTMFANKKVAMVGAGRWCISTWEKAGMTNDTFDCVQWPKNKQSGTVYGGAAWGISSTTKNLNYATELLKAMVSDETNKATAAGGQQIPPTKSLATSPEIMGETPDGINKLWTAVENGTPIAAPTYYGDLDTILMRDLENIFSGKTAVKAGLDQAQAEMQSKMS